MKKLIFCLLNIFPLAAFAQSSKPKTESKPTLIEHVLKDSRKTQFGFELSIISGANWKDDSLKTVEICFPDSTIRFASILYPEYRTFKKGELLKNTFYVVGDSLNPKARIAPLGTFKEFYPTEESAKASASIMFLIDIDSIPGEQYMLPDLVVAEGQISIGDTLTLIDDLGKKCVAKVNYLDISNEELNARIVVPFIRPEFYTESDQVRGVMYYSVLSGDSGLHENIKLVKL